MDPTALLDQLKDAHQPGSIDWWPLAIGWWIVIILTLVTLVLIGRYWYAARKRNAWRRLALKEYTALKKSYAQAPSSEALAEIISLLRRTVASSTNDRLTLSATGNSWKQRLSIPAHLLNEQDIQHLSEGHYLPEPPILDHAALNRIELWIKSQRSGVQSPQKQRRSHSAMPSISEDNSDQEVRA